MDYNKLLDLATDVGYNLAIHGAETFRVEESIALILQAYGLQAEAFSIPNCLIVSLKTDDGKSMTRMRRVGMHGNDLDGVERFSNLSRRICSEKPEPETVATWLEETKKSCKHHRIPFYLLAHFIGAFGFSVFFGSNIWDAFWSGILGAIVGIVNLIMNKFHVNTFFSTILASFCMSLPAYALASFGLISNADTVIIGTLMILVPGLLFTNAMRDIIYGDTNSGVNRIVQVFLIAAAIALGTATALQTINSLLGPLTIVPAFDSRIIPQFIGSLIGGIGFAVIFNVHGPGILLCTVGGVAAWATYCAVTALGTNDLTGYLIAAMASSLYAEIMARVRKSPAISYLVISIFPLLPGASIYYTMTCIVSGDMAQFSSLGLKTIAIAGAIAVGILLVSTTFRIWTVWKRKHNKK